MSRCRPGAGRLMSVAHTLDAVVDRSKTVTRRDGWLFIRSGDRLQLVDKAMGHSKGSHPTLIAEVLVVDVRRERLDAITTDDVSAEGFPDWSTAQFVEFYCDTFSAAPDGLVTRIEWAYLESMAVMGWAQPCLPGIG